MSKGEPDTSFSAERLADCVVGLSSLNDFKPHGKTNIAIWNVCTLYQAAEDTR